MTFKCITVRPVSIYIIHIGGDNITYLRRECSHIVFVIIHHSLIGNLLYSETPKYLQTALGR